MKKVLLFIAGVAFIINNSLTVTFATNNTELENNKVQFSQVSDELKKLDEEIATTNSEISSLNNDIKNNENNIHEVENKITNTEHKISQLEDDIKKSENALALRLREIYKSGSFSSLNYISFLFESEDLSDFFNRIVVCKAVITQDKKLINEINDNVNLLNKDKEDIVKQKENLVALNEDTKNKLSVVKEKEKTLSQNKDKLSQELSNLREEIKKNEEILVSKYINNINSVSTSSTSDLSKLNESASILSGLKDQITIKEVLDEINAALSSAETKKQEINALIEKEKAQSQTPVIPESSKPSGNYLKTLTMEATAYALHSTTAMGMTPVRNPNGLSTVAVDPSVIPLGSIVYVEGYGRAIASDTGSAIKNMKIDLYMNSEAECLAFGRKSVTVHIESYP
ncbi:MAG: hypothetical protein E7214_10605 [Clostridium sp.]|nr:hypothetical protein [Clostridium sp.]